MQPYTNYNLPDDDDLPDEYGPSDVDYAPEDQQPPDWIYVFMPSYSGKVFLAFILYFCGYLPGFVVNIALLLEALDMKDRFGRSPDGLGCLVALLLLSTVGLVALFALLTFSLTNWTRF